MSNLQQEIGKAVNCLATSIKSIREADDVDANERADLIAESQSQFAKYLTGLVQANIEKTSRDAPKIETPRDADPLSFNATGRGEAHTALWNSFDNYRRQMGPAQGRTAFQTAWAELDDDEKQTIRNEEAVTEAARQAAAAVVENERTKEMSKMDDSKIQAVIKLAHDVDAGRMGNHADRASWYRAITKAAATQRKPNETAQQSFARYITQDPGGKAMYRCYKSAAGSDYVPPTPEPARVIKADSAYARLKKIASDLREEKPDLKLTEAAAFLKVFTDPANRELAELSKRESAFA